MSMVRQSLDGELAVYDNVDKYFIIRIAWVFGKNGKNFIKTMLNVGKTHDTLKVVNDQIGTPTYTYDLARLMIDMILTDKYGYYHATNEGGYISWYDLTKEIFRQAVELGHTEYAEDKVTVLPVTTAEYGVSKAARPFNSRLDKKEAGRKRIHPSSNLAGCSGKIFERKLNSNSQNKAQSISKSIDCVFFISQNPEALLTPGFHSFYLLSSFLSDVPKIDFI